MASTNVFICLPIIYIVTVPGIFRTTGSLARVKSLKQLLNHKYELHLSEEFDIQTIASCFKLWLRELTDGILPQAYFAECMAAIDNRESLKQSLKKLPKANFESLQFILEFLLKLSAQSEVNKMTISNIAIVFGPCLVRLNAKDDQLTQVMKETVDYIFKAADTPQKEEEKEIQVSLGEAVPVKTTTETVVDAGKNDTTEPHIPFNPDEDSVSSM
jgi:hypothetical protein